MKKQEILNSLKKWTLTAVAFWVTIFWMVYAANIISVTTQTISTGDSIGAGWYQAVNDKLLNTYSKSDVYTKTEVNGKWYLTSHQDISNLATKTELGTKADSTSVYTKSETDSKYVKFWTTCTTSTVWIMKYDTVSKSMHICLDWKWIYFVSSIRLWEAESKPGLSCLDILNNWWNIWSGTYRIKPAWASSAFQAYCDMTNWWWTLVMKIKEWDTSLNYWSSYWTNTTTLNENDADISSDINMKNSAFSELAFSDIKFCMGTTDNCLLDNRSATSLKSLFSWASVNTSFSRSDFRTLFDNAWWWTTFSWMGNCNQSWYNKNSTSSSYYKCRFWIIFNNEGNCSSSDSSIWFWCSKSYWWRKYSCWWWHRYSERKKKWYIFIK